MLACSVSLGDTPDICFFCRKAVCSAHASKFLGEIACKTGTAYCYRERDRESICRGKCSHCGDWAVGEGEGVRHCTVCGKDTDPSEFVRKTVSTTT